MKRLTQAGLIIVVCVIICGVSTYAIESKVSRQEGPVESAMCSSIVPRELGQTQWDRLTAQNMELWVSQEFNDATDITILRDVEPAFSSGSWRTENYEYSAVFSDDKAYAIDVLYTGDSTVSLGRWLECVGDPEYFVADKVQRHSIETVVELYYPNKGMIVNIVTDEPNPTVVGINARVQSVTLVRPALSLEEMVHNSQGTYISGDLFEESLQGIRPWTGIGNGLVVEAEWDH